MKKNKKNIRMSTATKGWMILLLLPITITIYVSTILIWQEMQKVPFIKSLTETVQEVPKSILEIGIPEEYVSIYKEAAEEYQIPWTLLAAHHRIETRFSTMDPLLSPVGAEGHMQFMPCTFVGWQHPSCGDLGKGDIPEKDKTNPDVIAKYGGYGIDANKDGKADPYQIEDAMFSAAHYLSSNGASSGDIEHAIFMYNRSDEYVEDVMYYYNKYEQQQKREEQAALGKP